MSPVDFFTALGILVVFVGGGFGLFLVVAWWYEKWERGIWNMPLWLIGERYLEEDSRAKQPVRLFCLPTLGWKRTWGVVRIDRRERT